MNNYEPNLYSNPVLATYECEGQLSIEDCFPTMEELAPNAEYISNERCKIIIADKNNDKEGTAWY